MARFENREMQCSILLITIGSLSAGKAAGTFKAVQSEYVAPNQAHSSEKPMVMAIPKENIQASKLFRINKRRDERTVVRCQLSVVRCQPRNRLLLSPTSDPGAGHSETLELSRNVPSSQ
jgi:hypothetical protein